MKKILAAVLLSALFFAQAAAVDVRVKDVVQIKGLAEMPLIGYGLVVGLPGTGDRYETIIANQSLRNVLEKFGITIEKERLYTRNTAAVMVTAKLSPFAKKGNMTGVTVSALGDARSLTGGTLLLTTLLGPDGKPYVSSQGAITVGGYEEKAYGLKLRKNYPVVGTIADGGVVMNDLENNVLSQDDLFFVLRQGDYDLVRQLKEQINGLLETDMAVAMDANTVKLTVPLEYREKVVEMISMINAMTLSTSEEARIVVNERTGTVIIGDNVKIAPVAISHGDLTIKIKKTTKTQQPLPFTLDETQRTTEVVEEVEEEDKHLVMMEDGTTIQEVVNALNSIGATPRDVISILEALKAAGALHARIEVI